MLKLSTDVVSELMVISLLRELLADCALTKRGNKASNNMKNWRLIEFLFTKIRLIYGYTKRVFYVINFLIKKTFFLTKQLRNDVFLTVQTY
jgi:hypothetical protein